MGMDAGAAACGLLHVAPLPGHESDVLTADVWLKVILVQLADPIVAVYTSGGKSVHALVKISAATPEEFNAIKSEYVLRLSAVGERTPRP